MLRAWVAIVVALGWLSAAEGSAEENSPQNSAPLCIDPRLKIQLFADSPQIVTPTGIDVDARGRVWVIESNTHFPAADYKGNPTDRLLILEDTDRDGVADKIDAFATGFTHAMSVAVRREGREVYLATRREVLLLPDEDKNGSPEETKRILKLETAGDYPHNGLAGFAFDALGNMYIGLGENLGAAYRLVGSDGSTLSGEAEGGSLYRCRLDGSKLTRVATGFWNPHASCIDVFGRLFTVDNDPDSRPPCRLLHVVDDGDYGYRFRNGRRGTHPFTAWDGELPGTLPMVAGTGEAPSGIVAYESEGFPADFTGNLLVTSWGDHRIDRFRLKNTGTSFQSVAEPIVNGGENFRPVGLAVAPDGALFCSDWVRKDYNVHGQGRVWRISSVDVPKTVQPQSAPVAELGLKEAAQQLESRSLVVRRAAARSLAERAGGTDELRHALGSNAFSARARIEALWALLSAVPPGLADGNSGPFPPLASPDDEVATAFVTSSIRDRANRSAGFERLQQIAATNRWQSLLNFDTAAVDKFMDDLRRRPTRDPLFTLSLIEPFLNQQLVSHPELIAKLFEVDDPYVFRATIRLVANALTAGELAEAIQPQTTPSPRVRLGLVLAARAHDRNGLVKPVLEAALADPDASVRRAAVQWVGEDSLKELRPGLETALNVGQPSSQLMEAVLTSMEMLDGLKRSSIDESSGGEYALKILRDGNRAPRLRAIALRMLAPTDPRFDAALAEQLLSSDDRELKTEAVRAVGLSVLPKRWEMLLGIVRNEAAPAGLRADAVSSLFSGDPESVDETVAALQPFISAQDQTLRTESLRVLRNLLSKDEQTSKIAARTFKEHGGSDVKNSETRVAEEVAIIAEKLGLSVPVEVHSIVKRRPAGIEEWISATASGGDVDSGRRAFFRAGGAGCARCHRVEGRGGSIGPDLSAIARTQNRRKIAESILNPSKDIAPQFVTWSFVMSSGRTQTGFIIGDERNGKFTLGTAEGITTQIEVAEIEERRPQNVSVMPEKLVEQLSVHEFRDILAFLMALR